MLATYTICWYLVITPNQCHLTWYHVNELSRSWADIHLHPAMSLGWTVHRCSSNGGREEQNSHRGQQGMLNAKEFSLEGRYFLKLILSQFNDDKGIVNIGQASICSTHFIHALEVTGVRCSQYLQSRNSNFQGYELAEKVFPCHVFRSEIRIWRHDTGWSISS